MHCFCMLLFCGQAPVGNSQSVRNNWVDTVLSNLKSAATTMLHVICMHCHHQGCNGLVNKGRLKNTYSLLFIACQKQLMVQTRGDVTSSAGPKMLTCETSKLAVLPAL